MSTIANKKATSIRLNANLYACIEKLAKKQNRSINNYIETLLFEAIEESRVPNEETIEAINEVTNNRDKLQGFSSVKDMINSILNE
ncbi:MAG: hypothetical protein LBQ84_07050 [Flavobacteriaceae bacterium]|jgi:hypothetical protein|nr:hypothetical protein [Flavobacteriaceae bacterium]